MPEGLSQNTGTAEILRLPEVQSIVTGDFLVLPCDIVCEMNGESLLEACMIQETTLGGASGYKPANAGRIVNSGLEGRLRGGLGVWYQTRGDHSVKGEETDFVITASLPPPTVHPSADSLRSKLSKLVYSTTTATLTDIIEDKKGLPIRHGLIRKHGRVRILTTYRDAHIYIFPQWVMGMIKRNEKFDSISEDVVGWWAKAGWQDGLAKKIGMAGGSEGARDGHVARSSLQDDTLNLDDLCTTYTSDLSNFNSRKKLEEPVAQVDVPSKLLVVDDAIDTTPSILAYVHSSSPTDPLIRRVDTSALLLATSLHLAKVEARSDNGTSAFAHASKVEHPDGIAPRSTVSKSDCLLAANVTVEEKCVIKESVIGSNCEIKSGARLTRCLLMDGVIVGEKCQLTGCILGRRCKIGKGSVLKECEVQDGNVVSDETDAKSEKFMKALEDADSMDIENGVSGDEIGGNSTMAD